MKLPEISDEDIERAEEQWSLPKPLDSERRDILRSMETVDIRACPGGGKTTLLVIKLGILASKWIYKHRGICVLSHTNVARGEIEKRFSAIPSLHSLTRYPHYVGTVQSFLHIFLATSGAFEKFGVRPTVVDNNHYEIEAKREFFQGTKQNGRYSAANTFIRNSMRKNPAYSSVGDYISRYIEYIDENLSLPPLGTLKAPVSWDSLTGTQVQKFKQCMSEQGIFRYQDMAALAAWYLKSHPNIARLLQERFPIVFFDEMQDTILPQAQLLDIVFSENSVIQRFGDDRQAIYHSTSGDVDGAHFPRGKQLPMRKSFRVSPSIARLSQGVCADNPPEVLIGDSSKPDRKHTVFIFKRSSIKEVVPAFGRLVISQIGSGLEPSRIRAVGANSKPKGEDNKFPSAIGDYWDEFVPKKEQIQVRLTSLSAYFERACTEMTTTRNSGDARQLLLESCARILRLQGVVDNARPLTPSAMIFKLNEQSPKSHQQLNSLLAKTCQRLFNNNPPATVEFANELHPLLGLFNSQPWNSAVEQFILETSSTSSPGKKTLLLQDNVFLYTNAGETVSVKIDTIHSVKGETLTAILVLETVYYEHDLQVLTEKGYLKGKPPSIGPSKRILDHLKRIYVAMTRPTDLLCLAILDEHITNDDREALQKFGWVIEEIS